MLDIMRYQKDFETQIGYKTQKTPNPQVVMVFTLCEGCLPYVKERCHENLLR